MRTKEPNDVSQYGSMHGTAARSLSGSSARRSAVDSCAKPNHRERDC